MDDRNDPLPELAPYSEQQIEEELERRRSLRDEGKCDFCIQFGNTPDCMRPERHAVARTWWKVNTFMAAYGGKNKVMVERKD